MTTAARAVYQQVKRHVLGGIRTGRWRAGDRRSSQHELGREPGLARETLPRALGRLTREGLIVRRAGVGAFVAGEPLAESHPLEIRDIAAEVAARGHVWRAEVVALEAVTADAELARRFELAPGAPLFRSEIIHWEGATPIQLEQRWVSPEIAPDYLGQDFTAGTPGAHLLATAPIEAGEQIVRAEAADPRTAGLLRLAESAPVLTVARRTWSRGRVASAARLIHPGHAFQLAGRFGDRP